MCKRIVVVGASTDRSKYGNKAVRAFAAGGWTVFPVNPKENEIEKISCYPSVAEVPGPVDRVAMYVPPAVGKRMLEEIAAKKPNEFFLNPGSEDAELLAAARRLGLEPILACSIVNIGLRPDQFPDT